MLDSVFQRDAGLIISQGCWVQFWTGILLRLFMKIHHHEFIRDPGYNVTQGCWLQYLARMLDYVFYSDAGLFGWDKWMFVWQGNWFFLFERQARPRGRQCDWIDCSGSMLDSVLALIAEFIVSQRGWAKCLTGILDGFFDSDAGWSVWLETWISCSTRMLNWFFDRDAGLGVWHGCGIKCLKSRLGGLIDRDARLSV